ncbi:MAG: CAP domain-containing protein [Rhodospirillaceae bacterium]|nr:CAP domain-containing protein [Rhodospirillaceae bacterium]
MIARHTATAIVSAFAATVLFGLGAAKAGETDLAPYFQRLKTVEARKARPVARAPQMRAQRHVLPAAYGAMDIPTLERTVFSHINLYRLSRGMRPLAEKSDLAAVARNKSSGMATGAAPFSHAGMNDRLMPFMGGIFGYHSGGEILAYNRGAADPAKTAMISWINSPTHKEIIEGDYSRVGVGVARSPDGRYYFTALFLR